MPAFLFVARQGGPGSARSGQLISFTHLLDAGIDADDIIADPFIPGIQGARSEARVAVLGNKVARDGRVAIDDGLPTGTTVVSSELMNVSSGLMNRKGGLVRARAATVVVVWGG